MSCNECEFLRSKLSPLEDKEFTKLFLSAQPPTSWYRSHCVGGKRGPTITFSAQDLWESTFHSKGNSSEIAKLGRTLEALGWYRTHRDGYAFFTMPLEEFNDYYINN